MHDAYSVDQLLQIAKGGINAGSTLTRRGIYIQFRWRRVFSNRRGVYRGVFAPSESSGIFAF